MTVIDSMAKVVRCARALSDCLAEFSEKSPKPCGCTCCAEYVQALDDAIVELDKEATAAALHSNSGMPMTSNAEWARAADRKEHCIAQSEYVGPNQVHMYCQLLRGPHELHEAMDEAGIVYRWPVSSGDRR